MTDALQIQNLLDWRYAGKPADNVVPMYKRRVGPMPDLKPGEEDPRPLIYGLNSARQKGKTNEYQACEYHVEDGYLIPHYPPLQDTRARRNMELLVDRVQRFYYSCEPGLDTIRTHEEIESEITYFDKKLATIDAERAAAGKSPFSLSIPYREMTQLERELVTDGALIVGHAVNRLGRLGRVIMQRNHDGVKIEYDNKYIKEHKDEIGFEFLNLWMKLTNDVHQSLVRCVLTRDGKVDYDGVFHHLIREIAKPVFPYIAKERSPQKRSEDYELVGEARVNIVTQIGHCVAAIDEVAKNLQNISMNPSFSKLIDRAQKVRQSPGLRLMPEVNDLDLRHYRSLMREFADVCRARACVKSDDNDNFTLSYLGCGSSQVS
ncbi:MAG: hypothetical protein ACOYNL_00880 [Rickettsiales bacterium]